MNVLHHTFPPATWLGRPGQSHVWSKTVSRTTVGLRVVAVKFDDSEFVELKLVKGDGRKAGFEEFRSETVAATEMDRVAKLWLS